MLAGRGPLMRRTSLRAVDTVVNRPQGSRTFVYVSHDRRLSALPMQSEALVEAEIPCAWCQTAVINQDRFRYD
jgi:hypothetical protein